MVVNDAHPCDEHASLLQPQAAAQLYVAVGGKHRVEPARAEDDLPAVGTVSAVHVRCPHPVAGGVDIEVPGTEGFPVVDLLAQLRVEIVSIRGDYTTTECHRRRVGCHRPDETGQPAGCRHRVVVQERDDLALGDLEAGVAGLRDPHVDGQVHATVPAAWPKPPVRRAAVKHQDDLGAKQRLGGELFLHRRTQTPAALTALPRRDHHT